MPLLRHLRKAKIPIGLVSNVTGPSEIFERDLSEKGLRPYFDVVVWSSRVGVRKPNPEIYQIALERLKLEPSRLIVMIGDHEIADILEVFDTYIEVYGMNFEKILEIKEKKKKERGGFTKNIMLIAVCDQEDMVK